MGYLQFGFCGYPGMSSGFSRDITGVRAPGASTAPIRTSARLTARELGRWDDLIASYESRQLFHQKVWLDYLAASRGVEPRYWAVRDGARTVGYFCGAVVRKGPFKILGSPLKGWTTNFMGPLVNGGFDQEAFLRGVDALAKREGFAMAELENPILAPSAMKAFGYEGVGQPTYIVELTPEDQGKMWGRIDVKSRQKVKKARKLGLVVEEFDRLLASEKACRQLTAHGNVQIMTSTRVEAISGNGRLESVTLRSKDTDTLIEKKADGMFVYIGQDPQTALFSLCLYLQRGGYAEKRVLEA